MYNKASVLELDTSKVEAEKRHPLKSLVHLVYIDWIAHVAVFSTTTTEIRVQFRYVLYNLPNHSNIFAPSKNNSL